MKRTIALLASVSLSTLAPPVVHAGNVLPPPPLPQGYDVKALSSGPPNVTKDLKPLTSEHERPKDFSVFPSAGKGAAAGIQWSGYVAAGAIYSNAGKK
ncbi:hypothetical protein [Aestuariivirga sp.]|uniref:hypothetical protein n=1 Tax=Aestuariivirga sp. TaxID=2650926 RepID=UPI003BAA7F9E